MQYNAAAPGSQHLNFAMLALPAFERVALKPSGRPTRRRHPRVAAGQRGRWIGNSSGSDIVNLG
jgi:hypothetical protein